jgi:hypothetical protein
MGLTSREILTRKLNKNLRSKKKKSMLTKI